MIAYKVVEKGTRNCSNWTIRKHDPNNYDHSYKEAVMLRKKYSHLFPRYLHGRFIEAFPGSPGIFCCKTFEDAEKFQIFHKALRNFGKIIKVQGIGTPRLDAKIIRGSSNVFRLVNWYCNKNICNELVPIKNTFGVSPIISIIVFQVLLSFVFIILLS